VCRVASQVGAHALLDWLLPEGSSNTNTDTDTNTDPDPLRWPGYDDARGAARTRTGANESVTVRTGALRGTDLLLVAVAWDFGFLGGSMGSAAGARIAAAYDAATAARLPIVLLTATGGARMQEGMASLVQMASTTAAQAAHADAGLLQIAVLRHPTTGGVFASHANLADLIIAEPGATIGFAGPRVSAAMTGGPLPSGSHTATGAHAAGLVDAVVERPGIVRYLAAVLLWSTGVREDRAVQPAWVSGVVVDSFPSLPPPQPPGDAWAEVQRARATDRARAPQLLDTERVDVAATIRGDRAGGVDLAVKVVLAWWDTRSVVIIAMDPAGGSIGPAGYRTAWRALTIADRIGVPVVTIIDTPGADASAAAEAGGIAHHIAATTARLLAVRAPVVSLVLGEGGSGGALALAVADRLLLLEHATFSVIAPEGAAAILHRDPSRAAEVAELLDPTAARLESLGIADEVVPEPPGAEMVTAVEAVARHLGALASVDPRALAASRRQRWRRPLRDLEGPLTRD
jgi:acetyl-CoA carboxylase carboxyl transferase beta subunit